MKHEANEKLDLLGKALSLSGLVTLGVSLATVSFKSLEKQTVSVTMLALGAAQLYAGAAAIIKYRRQKNNGHLFDFIEEDSDALFSPQFGGRFREPDES